MNRDYVDPNRPEPTTAEILAVAARGQAFMDRCVDDALRNVARLPASIVMVLDQIERAHRR